ncbi:unnamed protein product, partial [Rotaria magnacalcarata]
MGLVSVTVSLVKNLLKSSVRDNQFLLDSTFAESIRIDESMAHLRELQRLANANNRTRTVNTHGFNQTLDYITDYLSTNTNYKITKSFFPNADWLAASPTPAGHIALLQGGDCNFAEKSIIVAKYNPLALLFCNDPIFSQPIIFSLAQTNELPALFLPYYLDADWLAASPTPAGHIALLQGGDCNFAENSIIVAKYNPLALLFYNDPIFPQPIIFSLAQINELPALFLSYYLGQLPADAARNPSMNAIVHINIDVLNTGTFPVGNMCADTPIEDITKTIVIGSHIDSVTTGPGINDK